jgi:AraC-like DNA-binding protein
METRLSLPISVADLAAEVGFERSYFSVVFKEKTGRSPHEYLTKLRITAACRELIAGMSVAEVAESVGLEPKNFSRIFKKYIGETPLGYSRRNKK